MRRYSGPFQFISRYKLYITRTAAEVHRIHNKNSVRMTFHNKTGDILRRITTLNNFTVGFLSNKVAEMDTSTIITPEGVSDSYYNNFSLDAFHLQSFR